MHAPDPQPPVLTRAVNAFPDALGLLDRAGVMLHANPALGRLLDAEPEDLRGCALQDLAADGPDQIAALLRLWAGSSTFRPGALRLLSRPLGQAAISGETGMPGRGETAVMRCDGARLETSMLLVRFTQRARASTLFGRVTQEVEARSLREMKVRLERSLAEQQRLNNLLTQANAELTQFASIVSHDLKAPLVTLTGYVDLLRSDYGKVLQDGMEFLEAIGRSAQRMSGVIEGLRALTRMEQSPPPREPVDSAAALRAALENLASQLASSGAQIQVEPLPPVVIPETYLVQVFQNLIGNSVKFRSQERPLVIDVGSRRADDLVEFTVRDSGLGVPEQEYEQIFELFGRGHTGGAGEGLGIGLALCRKIVERYGGRIWCEPDSPDDRPGATFRFTLPGEAA